MSKKKVEMHYDGYGFKMDLFKDLDFFTNNMPLEYFTPKLAFILIIGYSINMDLNSLNQMF